MITDETCPQRTKRVHNGQNVSAPDKRCPFGTNGVLSGQKMSQNGKAPITRADCRQGLRPCPWVRCKFHLFWEMPILSPNPKRMRKWERPKGSGINKPLTDSECLKMLFSMSETCTLDVADRGGVTLEKVGEILQVTRERVRQIEDSDKGKGGYLQKMKKLQRFKILEDFL